MLSLPANETSTRHFGGVGLMVEEPGVVITARLSDTWLAEGPLAERALGFAKQFFLSLPTQDRFRLHIERCAPEHIGLGTGTQLGLAVAKAVALACGRQDMDALELARRVGRGKRSALGIHGFAHGGFLVEGGKRPNSGIAPLLVRTDFPADWKIVLIIPQGEAGCHGVVEDQAFLNLRSDQTDVLCGLVLLGMLPALQEMELPAFGEALYEFNRRVGEMFRPIQGGIYSHPRSTAVVEFVRGKKISGVGQSSWGPAVFAIVEQDRAGWLAGILREQFRFSSNEVLVTQAWNSGATAWTL
jgi:beta-RFAP synthase